MKVLDGIRVIELTAWAAAPGSAAILGHWGADVVKIEHPTNPDPIRLVSAHSSGTSGVMFDHYNRSKRAITLDITADEGYEVLRRLVEGADVFVTSHLTATRKKLRCDVNDIRAMNPSVVFAKVTGQGPAGPEAERGGFDLATFWCRSGLADTTAMQTNVEEPPGMVGHGDGVTGFMLASGVCAALLQRERTGVTPVVDASLLGAAMWLLGPNIAGARTVPDERSEFVRREHRPASTNVYRTKDSRYVQLVFLAGERDWSDFFERAGRPELATDPRLADISAFGAAGSADYAEAVGVLDELFAERTLAEWREILAEAKGVWAPVQTLKELYSDPQVVANGFIRPVPGASDGLALVAPPVMFDGDPGSPGRAPGHGEHTVEVLRQVGFSDADLDRYREHGVIS